MDLYAVLLLPYEDRQNCFRLTVCKYSKYSSESEQQTTGNTRIEEYENMRATIGQVNTVAKANSR